MTHFFHSFVTFVIGGAVLEAKKSGKKRSNCHRGCEKEHETCVGMRRYQREGGLTVMQAEAPAKRPPDLL